VSVAVRRAVTATAATMIAVLVAAAVAHADGPAQIRIGVLSQTEGPRHASAKVSITAHQSGPAEPAHRGAVDLRTNAPGVGASTSASASAPPYPTLAATSQLAKNATPLGPGTFWYPGGAGISCVYAAGTSPLCYRITGPASAATPGVDPAALASNIAARLDLTPGAVEASPIGEGLTGAPSWFWLDPAPTTKQATITLAGESVTVVATPTITWAFGDGATLTNAGGGTPYMRGTPPASAMIHTYQTRCLTGDQGRDPNVLPSCQTNGYRVVAAVTWQFSYRASGPVSAAGTVPARTTDADRSYPVSEARAFLVGATQ
jgi:hypothetical protein